MFAASCRGAKNIIRLKVRKLEASFKSHVRFEVYVSPYIFLIEVKMKAYQFRRLMDKVEHEGRYIRKY